MNKSYLCFAVAILAFAAFKPGRAQTGCPGCQIDMSCYDASGPTLCPNTLPDGVQGQYYETDLTFWMPQNFNYQGINITLLQIVINSVSGLPQGLSWEPNNPSMIYNITSDPATQRGCVKLCGTPAIFGNFTITIQITATVNTPLGQQVEPQSFTLNLIVHPQPGGNPFFTFNPSAGCGSATVQFEALVGANPPQMVTYQWDFGNGQTSTLPVPPQVNYPAPGTYPVSLTTTIYDLVFNSLVVSASGGWYSGDVEEFFGGLPDMFFGLTHGNNYYESNYISDSNPAHFQNLGIVLSDWHLTLDIWEYDPVSSNDNGGSFTIQINGPGMYNFSTSAPGGGGTTGTFTITQQVNSQYPFTDTLVVYDLPPLVPIAVHPGTTVCEGKSITLSVYGGYLYQWYENDTIALAGADDSSFVVTAVGNLPLTRTLKVRITDPQTGCSITTPSVTVTINPGIPSNFSTNGIMINPFNSGQLTTNFVGNFTYQWLLNGNPIPGATSKDLTIAGNGSYALIITNAYGCSDTSNVITINTWSVELSEGKAPSIWPNPTSGDVWVHWNGPVTGEIKYHILDLTGRTLRRGIMPPPQGNGTFRLSLHDLSPGQYLLTLSDARGQWTRPVIRR